jgi:hypothetical protein
MPVATVAVRGTQASSMIRIAISAAAYAAIADTMPLGSVAVEPAANEKGERSDVILRLAAAERGSDK